METDASDEPEEKYNPANDDDDPIVQGIPVYLNKSVSCYLFQYPVRPSSLTYDTCQVTRAKFKPNNQQVQLELKLNTHSENYDKSKGEQIALNTDGCNSAAGADKYFQSNVMDKQVLTGTRVSDIGRYAVARLVDRELHLNQVKDYKYRIV